jgi:glycosyltransferase involved in cell wall biosynthesis
MATEPEAPTAEPLVTILLPVYNGEPYLEAALDSALSQTYRNLEVIVVDDGSVDRTRELVKARAAKDPRVRLIAQQNRGVAAARNRAIGAARGEFIAPLDADDIWHPAKIERQVRRMIESGSNTGLVYCWWVWIDEDNTVIDQSPQWRIEGRTADALLQVNYVGCASIPLFRRRVVQELGGYDETMLDGCEDWDLSVRVAERAQVAVVPATLVAYRRHRRSMSTEMSAMRRAHRTFLDRLRGRRPDIDPALIRRSEDQFTLYLAGVCFWCRRYGQALRCGARTLRSTLGFEVLPYVARTVARTLRRRGTAGTAIRPGLPFGTDGLRDSLIPYDRIYARRFERLPTRPCPSSGPFAPAGPNSRTASTRRT